ncbi:hypothetical protein I551_5999 [Mycobacterium ulcerans str. Harvey]|uniref:DegV family protein n=1 Tax=Mycobacterium ulcerans str. Harvey TaxID=1299332 RepID=A0ABP3A7Z4_MYCUL|nr:hypothetical protein I551_5999 [Mycobacterium ulcerans str. Harvey]
MAVVVVTDTSARLPVDIRERWAIREVPLHILLDGVDLRDGVDEVPDDIHKCHATTAAATRPSCVPPIAQRWPIVPVMG